MIARALSGDFFVWLVLLEKKVLCLEEAGQAGACHSARPISGRPRLGVPSVPHRLAVVWLDQSRSFDWLLVMIVCILVNRRVSVQVLYMNSSA